MNSLLLFLIIWGVWILIPVVIDGFYALVHLVYGFIYGPACKKPEVTFMNYLTSCRFCELYDQETKDCKRPQIKEEDLPLVSVLIPTYNEEANIDQCLNSLKVQDYPHQKMEIIVIDDGSLDKTKELVVNHINGLNNGNGPPQADGKKHLNGGGKLNGNGNINGNGNGKIKINGKTYEANGFAGKIRLHTNGHRGKAYALNTGISQAQGEIIINIDCDVVLAPQAIKNMVIAFLKNKNLGAATGNIEINWELFEEKDHNNLTVLDSKGEPKTKKLGLSQAFLSRCQLLEYLNAFRLGREQQCRTNSLFTLAGAFSAFRANVLMKSTMYRHKTVSEDTDLTFDLRNQDINIGYATDAKAYLKPALSWDRLYAQRVRWSRGELEVAGIHREEMKTEKFHFFKNLSLPLTLAIDHTLSFPRLIWTLLLPLFFLFGYPPRVIFTALFLMYLFYIAVDFINTGACYFISDKDTKKQIEKNLYWCLALPAFRFITYYFRMAGYLIALKEPARWQVPGMVSELKNGVNGVKNGFNGFKNGVKNGFHNGHKIPHPGGADFSLQKGLKEPLPVEIIFLKLEKGQKYYQLNQAKAAWRELKEALTLAKKSKDEEAEEEITYLLKALAN